MRRWYVLTCVAVLATTFSFDWNGGTGISPVSDEEAALVYGGGLDALLSGASCNGTATGCQSTSGYYSLEAGTRDSQNKYCGASGCGTVVTDLGSCRE